MYFFKFLIFSWFVCIIIAESAQPKKRGLLLLAASKLGTMVDGVGSLSTSNSFRVFGKVFNYALSLSYGNAAPVATYPSIGSPPPLPSLPSLPVPIASSVPGVRVGNDDTIPGEQPSSPPPLFREIKKDKSQEIKHEFNSKFPPRENEITNVPIQASMANNQDMLQKDRDAFFRNHNSMVEVVNKQLVEHGRIKSLRFPRLTTQYQQIYMKNILPIGPHGVSGDRMAWLRQPYPYKH